MRGDSYFSLIVQSRYRQPCSPSQMLGGFVSAAGSVLIFSGRATPAMEAGASDHVWSFGRSDSFARTEPWLTLFL